MLNRIAALCLVAVLTACGGGGNSPTAPGPAPTPIPTPVPPPAPLFTRTGVGDTVFDVPTSVRRILIQATYPGRTTNFIVRIGGRLVVNELLGTAWPSSSFEGTYVTTGGVAEITNSSGVTWTFTEVR